MWTVNFQMFKLVLEKAEEPEIKLPTFTGSSKKQEDSRKTSISVLLTMPKPLTVWIKIKCGKFWKRWEYQTTRPASWEPVCRTRSKVINGHGTVDLFKIEKGVCEGCILSPCLFNFYTEYFHGVAKSRAQQSDWTLGLDDSQAGIKLPGEISTTSDIQIIPL